MSAYTPCVVSNGSRKTPTLIVHKNPTPARHVGCTVSWPTFNELAEQLELDVEIDRGGYARVCWQKGVYARRARARRLREDYANR